MDVEAQEDGVLGKIIVSCAHAIFCSPPQCMPGKQAAAHKLPATHLILTLLLFLANHFEYAHASHGLQLGNGTKEVPVGKVIALLAEEGDDISNLEVPAEEQGGEAQQQAGAKKEEEKEKGASKAAEQKKEQQQAAASGATSSSSASASPSTSTSAPSSSHGSSHSSSGAIFPSVARLLAEHHLSASDVSSGKGSGVRGMLTKGDVLAHLGLAPGGPQGTLKADPRKAGGIATMYGQGATPSSASGAGAGAGAAAGVMKDTKPLGEAELRRLIIAGLAGAAAQARAAPRAIATQEAPAAAPAPAQAAAPTSSSSSSSSRATLDRQYASLLSGYSFQQKKKAGPSLPQGAGAGAGAGGKKGANPFAGLL